MCIEKLTASYIIQKCKIGWTPISVGIRMYLKIPVSILRIEQQTLT